MIHSRNKAGFTLLEVLVAIAILGFVMVPVYNLLANVLGSSTQWARRMERIKQAQLFFYDFVQLREKDSTASRTAEKKITNLETSLSYQLANVPEGSPLKKFKDVMVEKVELQWQQGRNRGHDALITFVFKPEKP